MTDCVFCKIVGGEIPAQIIFAGENCTAFLDAHPLSAGHTVIVPNTHGETVLDFSREILGEMLDLARRTVVAVNRVAPADGFTLGINHGRYAGQAVPHLHLHVIPRRQGDGGKSIHSLVAGQALDLDPEIGQKLKEALKSLS